MSHNSLGTSYCRIPAKRTGISRKTSAFIAGRNGADREVPTCFARGGTGRYGTLKVFNMKSKEWVTSLCMCVCVHACMCVCVCVYVCVCVCVCVTDVRSEPILFAPKSTSRTQVYSGRRHGLTGEIEMLWWDTGTVCRSDRKLVVCERDCTSEKFCLDKISWPEMR